MSKTANGLSAYSLAGLEAAGVLIKQVVQRDVTRAHRSRRAVCPSKSVAPFAPHLHYFSANTVFTGSNTSSAYPKLVTESWTPFYIKRPLPIPEALFERTSYLLDGSLSANQRGVDCAQQSALFMGFCPRVSRCSSNTIHDHVGDTHWPRNTYYQDSSYCLCSNSRVQAHCDIHNLFHKCLVTHTRAESNLFGTKNSRILCPLAPLYRQSPAYSLTKSNASLSSPTHWFLTGTGDGGAQDIRHGHGSRDMRK